MALVLGLLVAACAQPHVATVQLGSGVRFVPEVADSVDDAGAFASVAVTSDDQPYVAYFGFPETLPETQTANPRPIGLPSVPGVLLATVSDGIWTRGATAMAAPIANVNVAFDPATDKAVGKLTRQNVTGLDLEIDAQGGLHVAWGSSGGLYYQSGSGDPASSTPWTLEQVSSQPVRGISLAIDGQGNPWIAGYTGGGKLASVTLWTNGGGGWTSEVVSSAQGCPTCATAVLPGSGGPEVAFGAGGQVWIAGKTGKSWRSQSVGPGGEGLDGAVGADGDADLSYYSNDQVVLASGTPQSLQPAQVTTVAAGSATVEGARTSVAVDKDGNVTVGWFDKASDSVRLATGKPGGQLAPVDVGDSTASGTFPSVGVPPDGSTSYVAWYQTAQGPPVSGVVPGDDVLLGTYGSVQGLGLAVQSPTPTPVANPSPSVAPTGGTGTTGTTGGGACTQPKGGKITVVAQGTAFDTNCIQEPANSPLTIDFENKDTQVPHNIEIDTADPIQDPSAKTLFEPPGGATITGPDSTTYDVPPLKPGDYHFFCAVHPTLMFGTFTVK